MNKILLHKRILQRWKRHGFIFTMGCVLLFMISGCSSDIDNPDPDPKPPIVIPEETAYLSLSVDVGKRVETKSYDGTSLGSPSEQYVHDVRIVLYDGKEEESTVVKTFDFKIKTANSGNVRWEDESTDGKDLSPTTDQSTGSSSFKTYARKVPYMDYYMLVLINPNDYLKGITDEIESGQKNKLKEFLAARKIETGNKKSVNVGGLATENSFLMVNEAELKQVDKADLKGSIREAHNAPVAVKVERVVAKISVGPKNTSSIIIKDGAALGDITWELDVTNRYTYWMRVPDNSHGSGRSNWYAIDPNFSGISGDDGLRADNFFYFSTDDQVKTPQFSNTFNNSEYCLENTMDVSEQSKNNVITRALIRCVYKPANVAAVGNSFYVFRDYVYSTDEMKEFAEIVEQTPDNVTLSGIYKTIRDFKQDNITFLNGHPEKSPGGEIKESIEQRGLNYFYEGVCYYAVKVLHFGTEDLKTPPPAGHYGVLRNTHYTININEILGPGSPTLFSSAIYTRSGESPDTSPMYDNIRTEITQIRE